MADLRYCGSSSGDVVSHSIASRSMMDGEKRLEEFQLMPPPHLLTARMGNSESRFREAVHNGDFTRAYELFYNKKLIRDNIDPKEVCYQQDSACLLHYTARHAMQPLYEEFLDNRHVSPLITDKHFNNCLHLICSSDRDDDIRCEMLKTTLSNQYLESSEASRSRAVSFCNSEGNTPLHLASCHGLTRCVQLLIEAGASPLVANNDQKTPIDMTTDDTIASKLEAKIVFADTGLNDMDVSVTDTAGEMSSSNLAMKNQEIQSMKDLLVIETSELLGISLFTAEALLRTHEWSKESLVNEWMNDPKGTCEKAGVQLPAVLSIDNICQPVQLARTISSTVDCSICYIDISRPAAIPCGHTFCNDCWKQYLHEKIKNGQVHNIVCPEYACYKLVPIEIVEELVSRDMATKYLQYDIKAFVDSNPNIRWCPFPGCGQALQKPPDEFVLEEGEGGKDEGDRQALVVHCGQNHFFCWRCGEKAHEPCTCKVWKNWLVKVDELPIKIESLSVDVREAASTSQRMLSVKVHEAASTSQRMLSVKVHEAASTSQRMLPVKVHEAASTSQRMLPVKVHEAASTSQRMLPVKVHEAASTSQWMLYNSKPCPKCNVPIEKNDGCNHMKCFKCRHDFCWVCLKPWKEHSSSTGGYYNCNRFEDIKKAEEKLEIRKKETNELVQLSRFHHYFDRYSNHCHSLQLEIKYLSRADERMCELQHTAVKEGATVSNVQFVKEAMKALVEARYTLAASYGYGYFLEIVPIRTRFEVVQGGLEEQVELLADGIAKPHLRKPKSEIVKLTETVRKKRKEFVEFVRKDLYPPPKPPLPPTDVTQYMRERREREQAERERQRELYEREEEERQFNEAIKRSKEETMRLNEDRQLQEAINLSKEEYEETVQLKSDTDIAIVLSLVDENDDGDSDSIDKGPVHERSSANADNLSMRNNLDLYNWRQLMLSEECWEPSSPSSVASSPEKTYVNNTQYQQQHNDGDNNHDGYGPLYGEDEDLATAIALSLSNQNN